MFFNHLCDCHSLSIYTQIIVFLLIWVIYVFLDNSLMYAYIWINEYIFPKTFTEENLLSLLNIFICTHYQRLIQCNTLNTSWAICIHVLVFKSVLCLYFNVLKYFCSFSCFFACICIKNRKIEKTNLNLYEKGGREDLGGVG